MRDILSVSYDRTLLLNRQQLLESKGYRVISASGFSESIELCKSADRFGVLILGHSIPLQEQKALIEAFRSHRPQSQVIALKRAWDEAVPGADISIEAAPDELLASVARVIRAKGTTA